MLHAQHEPSRSLPITRLRLHFIATTTVHLPAYQGSTWRGLFGHLLKRTVCVTRIARCNDCSLYHSCVHASLFDTPVPLNTKKMRHYTHAPHPFVFELPWQARTTLQPGDSIHVGLNLFGNALQQLAYIVAAFQKIPSISVGKNKGRLQFQSLEVEQHPGQRDWQTCWQADSPDSLLKTTNRQPLAPPAQPLQGIHIELHTPLRLSENNRNLRAEQFQFHHLFRNLLRRVSLISYFHTSQPYETDFAAITRTARALEIHDKQLKWHDWTRYSNRKQRHIKMGGLRGSFRIGTLPDEMWHLLWLGQWLHAGKGAVMGLGHYSLQPASLPTE